ncbi:Hypothetical predicted protein [Podarcis lilfordi]|uniref:Uncharacterized protein n=1 Tax=Podarcis lilfordi TaxID=74358 RepID=A0AA35PAK5_9SAUR|nr:Hypothetical predicted protein [Podarcis lilfordi]
MLQGSVVCVARQQSHRRCRVAMATEKERGARKARSVQPLSISFGATSQSEARETRKCRLKERRDYISQHTPLPTQRSPRPERHSRSAGEEGLRMASGDSSSLHTIHSALQECFRALQEQHEAWKRVLAACTPLLSSLANLAEQMQASQKVSFANTPLRDFPDLPERLRHKQQCAMEALLEVLQQDHLMELQKVRDTVGVCVDSVFRLCEQPGDGLSLETTFQRSASCPSLADMLEWLLDVEEFYHRVYLGLKFLLLQVSYTNLMEMQALPKAWEQVLQQGLQNTAEEVLLKVSFFLEAV